MIETPRCFTRKCKHYIGIAQSDGTEMTEVPVCQAYPGRIPIEIAYGDDLHKKVRPDQNNEIVYERKTETE